MKELLVTSSFPRSGNTFLNYALRNIYYPNQNPNINYHTVVALSKFNKVIIPLRNPLDCISSWNYYPSGHTLENDIKFYLRFFNAVFEADNVIIADFDKFTINLEYIKQLVISNFGSILSHETSIDKIKTSMKSDNKLLNLPDDNRAETINKIKEKLVDMPAFSNCLKLYNELITTKEQ